MRSLFKFLKAKSPSAGKVFAKDELQLRGSGLIRFQVGLVVALGLVLLVIHLPVSASAVSVPSEVSFPEEPPAFIMPEIRVERRELPAVNKEPDPVQVPVAELTHLVTVKVPVIDQGKMAQETLDPDEITFVEEPTGPVSVLAVEEVPLFPGCGPELSSRDRVDCMNDHINALVKKEFRISIAERYGLTGVQRIYVQFTLASSGLISNVVIRAPHPALEREVKRLLGMFPEFIPGRQQGRPVDVIYSKPIVFKVQ